MVNITKKIGCIGTGTMGFSTALSCAMANYQVIMYGRSQESITKGLNNIKAAVAKLQERQVISQEEMQQILLRIETTTDLAEVCTQSTFLIESVAEDLKLKKELFLKFAELCPPEAVMGSNTSGLSPTQFSEGNPRAAQIVVIHFWNPAHLIPLVEIVPGEMTSQETIERSYDFILSLNKKPIVMKKELPGFIGNRLQFALLREALYLLEIGAASAADIDAAVKYSFGRRLAVTGPIESADLGGLDIFYNIASYLWADLSNATFPEGTLKERYENGHLGSKTGLGFYNWEDSKSQTIRASREEELIYWLKKDLGVK